MSVIVIHGENMVQSRQKLVEVLTKMSDEVESSDVIRLEAKKIDLPSLEQHLGHSSLFARPIVVVIEELHSLPRSTKKNELINLIASAGRIEGGPTVVLWEKRLLTATMLKQFGSTAIIHTFKASKTIFNLVEQLSGTGKQWGARLPLLHKAIAEEGDFFVFTMIIRQIRMLIQIKDGGRPAGPPFVINKLGSQAKTFSLEQLLKLHSQLTQIDYNYKRSASQLELAQELDLLLMTL